MSNWQSAPLAPVSGHLLLVSRLFPSSFSTFWSELAFFFSGLSLLLELCRRKGQSVGRARGSQQSQPTTHPTSPGTMDMSLHPFSSPGFCTSRMGPHPSSIW